MGMLCDNSEKSIWFRIFFLRDYKLFLCIFTHLPTRFCFLLSFHFYIGLKQQVVICHVSVGKQWLH